MAGYGKILQLHIQFELLKNFVLHFLTKQSQQGMWFQNENPGYLLFLRDHNKKGQAISKLPKLVQ